MPEESSNPSEMVLLRRPPESGVPLAAAAVAVVLAVGYGVLLGYALELPDAGRAIAFVLYFAGLGAGVAFAARCCPTSAGIGTFAFVVVPPVLTRVGSRTEWPQPIVALAAAGGVAFGMFLLAVGSEMLLQRPESLRSSLAGRDAVGGVLVGLALTIAVFAAWTPPETVYRSQWVRLVQYLVVATRGLFLVASGVIPVLFATRKRVITPAILVGSVYGIAALPGGAGYTVWSATPGFLAEHGIVLPVLALAAGFVELAVSVLFGRLLKAEPATVGH